LAFEEMAVSPELLTPVIRVKTNVPLPEYKPATSLAGPSIEQPSKDQKVLLKICSEFTNYSTAANSFGTEGKPILVCDADGNPMIFAISSNGHLTLGLHVDGAIQGLQLYSLRPSGKDGLISAFDVLKDERSDTLYLAASLQTKDTSVVYYAAFTIPRLSFDPKSRKVLGFNPETDVKWTAIKNNMGPKNVSSILCGLVNNTLAISADFQIIVGTVESKDIQGAHYSIDPSPDNQSPWKLIENFEEAKKIIEL
jgi:hypothetical protein